MNSREMNPRQRGFAELYRRLSSRLEAYIRSMNIDSETAMDIAQESFIRLYNNMDCSDPLLPGLKSYLYTIARNMVIDQYRRSARGQVVLTMEEVELDRAFLESLEDTYITGEVIGTVNDTIDSFSPDERNIILFCIMGKRNSINRKENGITTYRVRRVRDELRARLKERLSPIIGPWQEGKWG